MKSILFVLLFFSISSHVFSNEENDMNSDINNMISFNKEGRPSDAPSLQLSIEALEKVRAKVIFITERKLLETKARYKCSNYLSETNDVKSVEKKDPICFRLLDHYLNRLQFSYVQFLHAKSLIIHHPETRLHYFFSKNNLLTVIDYPEKRNMMKNFLYLKSIQNDYIHQLHFGSAVKFEITLNDQEEKYIQDSIIHKIKFFCENKFIQRSNNFCKILFSENQMEKEKRKDPSFILELEDFQKKIISFYTADFLPDLEKQLLNAIQAVPEIMFLNLNEGPSKLRLQFKVGLKESMLASQRFYTQLSTIEDKIKSSNHQLSQLRYYLNFIHLLNDQELSSDEVAALNYEINNTPPEEIIKHGASLFGNLFIFSSCVSAPLIQPKNASFSLLNPFKWRMPSFISKQYNREICQATIPYILGSYYLDTNLNYHDNYDNWISLQGKKFEDVNLDFESFVFQMAMIPLDLVIIHAIVNLKSYPIYQQFLNKIKKDQLDKIGKKEYIILPSNLDNL